ncbi:glycoside hydrolase superfamily [Talaromyces proteolyticus]|uniref:beta-glucosidase n=1 Tax=Talaromyces proteolyticus TaxID=1131652 RepID=A0AAD4Q4N3_9EURO|nr:glycoside hydrolase superfamily [Talaromyces proteolyticus]KAH8703190.1 glycoside hydrolase superfamily [Talaromyces proteolyticus]
MACPGAACKQFPAGITTAATWDRDFIYARSYAMGKEYCDLEIHVAMGMVTVGGTNPYDTGIATWHGVKGMMDSGVQICSKHVIAYEYETFRNPTNFTEPCGIYNASEQVPISSNVDENTTHDIHLWSFAEAVSAVTTHKMCAYNAINDTHSCANSESNNGLLKAEFGF